MIRDRNVVARGSEAAAGSLATPRPAWQARALARDPNGAAPVHRRRRPGRRGQDDARPDPGRAAPAPGSSPRPSRRTRSSAGFYADRQKYAFQAQIFFLLSRFQQQQALFQQDLFSQSTVADYLFPRDRIFAALTLAPEELALYDRLYELLGPRVVKPDLVVYLQARTDVLLARVRKRGRDFERSIDAAWLEALARAYNDFFFHYDETPLLVVNASDIDLEGNPEDVEALLGVIRKHRKGRQHYVPLGTRAY